MDFNLKTAVERARGFVRAGVWREATALWAGARKEEDKARRLPERASVRIADSPDW